MPSAATIPRLDALTGLRWWAAFAVFAHHMTNFAPLPAHSFLALGAQGVTFFFVLSGFVLTWSARPEVSARTFWWRRFARIWPAHMVALILAVPVFYAAEPDQPFVKPFAVGVLLLSVVLLQGWSTSPAVLFSGNPAAWTLSVEAFFYATHPAANRALSRLGRRGALVAVATLPVLAAAFYLARAEVPLLAETPQPVMRLWEFLLGMAMARAVQLGWRPWLPVPLAVAALAAGALALWGGPRLAPSGWAALHGDALAPVLIGAVSAVVLLAYALRELGGGRSWASSRVMVRLGEISYAFYLVHATVVYGMLHVLDKRPTGFANLGWYAVLLVASAALAWLLHRGVEKPVERRIRRWRDERDRRAAGRLPAPAGAARR